MEDKHQEAGIEAWVEIGELTFSCNHKALRELDLG